MLGCVVHRYSHLIIMHVFERVAHNTNPHVDQVRGSHLKDLLGELFTVLIDLLQRERKRYCTIYSK